MTLSPRAQTLARSASMLLEHIKEHDKVSPDEVDQLLATIIAHVRSCRPYLLGAVL